MTKDVQRFAAGPASGFAGATSGTGLIYLGFQIGGIWGTILVYSSPLIGWGLAYGVYRWNEWVDRRTEQRAMRELDQQIAPLLSGDDLSDAEKAELKRAVAELKLHAGHRSIERVRILLDAPDSSRGGPPKLDLEAWRAVARSQPGPAEAGGREQGLPDGENPA